MRAVRLYSGERGRSGEFRRTAIRGKPPAGIAIHVGVTGTGSDTLQFNFRDDVGYIAPGPRFRSAFQNLPK